MPDLDGGAVEGWGQQPNRLITSVTSNVLRKNKLTVTFLEQLDAKCSAI